MSSLYIKQLEVGPMDNFVYLIGDRNTGQALVIDPGWNADEILKAADKDGFRIVGALMTHTHYDHANALEQLLKKLDRAVVYVHEKEAGFAKGLGERLVKTSDGQHIKIGTVDISCLHTPGHTPGSQCFLVENHLFSGDTLFIGACGRCDLPGGDAETMYRSLKQLSELDESIVLYPGHNYADEPTSTIGKEKQTNPYLQPANLKEFLKSRMA